MSQTHFLTRPEGRVAYDVTGDGPLVVCVPGMGDLRSTYRHLTPALAAAGYRVATMDLRGHGGSDTTFSAYDDVAAGTDALALLDELDELDELGGPAILVGSSMGAGAVAWAAAERPERVAGLVLVGPFVRNPSGNPLLGPLFRAMLLRPWGPAALRAWIPKLYAGVLPPDHADHVAAVMAAATRPGHWRAFQATARTSHAPVEARLADVSAPALVVMGDRDPDFRDPAAEAQWIGATLDAAVLLVQDAGHYPHAQRPDVVSPAVVAFAGRVHRRG